MRILLVLAALGPAPAQAPWIPSEPLPTSCAGTAASRLPDSLARLAAYPARADWETRAALLREGMRRKLKLDPEPARAPLKAVLQGRREQAAMGISIENAFFESVPGFFVTGNLYRPLKPGPHPPGILRPHGHGTAPRFAEELQRHCAGLAAMGAIVFAYDMVGKGESNQVPHCLPEGVLGMQTWNSLRAVDFLLELGADPGRIGITGESGGGTQAFMAAALDPRIALAMPAVIVGGTSAGVWMGGCNCEATGMSVHQDTVAGNGIADYRTHPVEIAALAAPRPLLILSDAKDGLAPDAPSRALPWLRSIYRLYGSEGGSEAAVAGFHDTTGHNFHSHKRMASYRFLADRFGMGPALPDESRFRPAPAESLLCFTAKTPRPAHALTSRTAILDAFFRNPASAVRPAPRAHPGLPASRRYDVAGKRIGPRRTTGKAQR